MSERPPLYFYEDARARMFEPFASTRPIATLAAGTSPIWARWQTALQLASKHTVAVPPLADFDESDTPAVFARGVIPAGSVLAHSRFAPALEVVPSQASVWRSAGRVVAVRLTRDLAVESLADTSFDQLAERDGASAELDGWWINEVWDLVRFLPDQIVDDLARLRALPESPARGAPPPHATVIGDHPVMVSSDAVIEPLVVLDASAGPIAIGAGSHVHAFTRINGPCYIGRKVNVMGGDISACSIGDVCKVRGEMSNTVFLSHSNKGHDGFIGHSYLGKWVNLGASTVTSNLKNTYGTVSLWTPSGVRDTGMQFLGTLFGDHAKTGIGLKLTTGTVLGAGANVYGGTIPPKVVPPFAWGDAPPYAVYQKEKFLEAAERMMSRRKVPLSEKARRHWTAVHDGRWTAETNAK